ncbi:MAG: diaminopimelate epimerase, partial [bacterium]
YLTDKGHQPSGIYPINTRDGRKFLSVPESGDITVNMGKVSQVPGEINVSTGANSFTGLNIDMGNPHAVVFVENMDLIGDLKSAPKVEPADEYPDGVNVEFVKFLENDQIQMRVHERGVG